MANPGMERFFKSTDVIFALAVIGMLVIMVIPLPFFMLDLLLTLNISLAVIILLVSIYTKEALDFSSFPSLLLIATLFRLSLNVASTRLILLQGSNFDGRVIKAFGNFVVGGNYVVGIVVFCILIVIQFVVITKGAQRIAEVAARFTLDAMPGKQMAIDADLNAGIINETEAMKRRLRISQEADFYGAMDGASKFVRGDAIAGIIITLINIIGGFVIGVFQKHMPAVDSARVYTLLTVGDGLVTQIPALLISTAAGIIVSRAASENNMGIEVAMQLFSSPRAIFIASGLLVFFAMVPGLPKVPFLLMAGVFGFIGSVVLQHSPELALESGGVGVSEGAGPASAAGEGPEPESAAQEAVSSYDDVITSDMLELDIGYGLISLADEDKGGDLLSRVTAVRRQIAHELGIIVPPVRVRDDMRLSANTYVIRLKGSEISRGEVSPNKFLAMDPGTADGRLQGEQTTEPTFGLPAWWIDESEVQRAERKGYTVVDAGTVVITNLAEMIRSYAYELLTKQSVKDLVDAVKKRYPAIVEEVVPGVVGIGELQKVLQNLLRERIPIKDIVTILEVIGDYGQKIKDTDILTEYVRFSLARTITSLYAGEDGKMHCITITPQTEEELRNCVQRGDFESRIVMDPSRAQQFVNTLSDHYNRVSAKGENVVLLVSPQIRLYLSRFLNRSLPYLPVLSYNEIVSGVDIVTEAVVGL